MLDLLLPDKVCDCSLPSDPGGVDKYRPTLTGTPSVNRKCLKKIANATYLTVHSTQIVQIKGF